MFNLKLLAKESYVKLSASNFRLQVEKKYVHHSPSQATSQDIPAIYLSQFLYYFYKLVILHSRTRVLLRNISSTLCVSLRMLSFTPLCFVMDLFKLFLYLNSLCISGLAGASEFLLVVFWIVPTFKLPCECEQLLLRLSIKNKQI